MEWPRPPPSKWPYACIFSLCFSMAVQRACACSCRKLDTHGPRWTHPSLQEVLMGVPFLRHISPTMFEWLRCVRAAWSVCFWCVHVQRWCVALGPIPPHLHSYVSFAFVTLPPHPPSSCTLFMCRAFCCPAPQNACWAKERCRSTSS